MASLVSPCRFTASLPHLTPPTSSIRNRLSFLNPLRVTTRDLSKLSSTKSMSQPSSDPQNDVVKTQNNDDVLVQYVVLRRDLIDTWPMGSVVTQGCHASVCAIWSHKDDPHTIQYCSPQNIDSMHKVKLLCFGFDLFGFCLIIFSNWIVHFCQP